MEERKITSEYRPDLAAFTSMIEAAFELPNVIDCAAGEKALGEGHVWLIVLGMPVHTPPGEDAFVFCSMGEDPVYGQSDSGTRES